MSNLIIDELPPPELAFEDEILLLERLLEAPDLKQSFISAKNEASENWFFRTCYAKLINEMPIQ